jgi:hypothetical protein
MNKVQAKLGRQLQEQNERMRVALMRIANMAVVDGAVAAEAVEIAREALKMKAKIST